MGQDLQDEGPDGTGSGLRERDSRVMTFGYFEDGAGFNTEFTEGALSPGGLNWEGLLCRFFYGFRVVFG